MNGQIVRGVNPVEPGARQVQDVVQMRTVTPGSNRLMIARLLRS